jgi:VWFA-related protein
VACSVWAKETDQNGQSGKGDAARQGYVIHETTHRVLVDVIVTDDKGKPVHGLKKGDFSVSEDKKPQKILSFDVEDGDKPDFVPPTLPPLPANTFIDLPKEPEQGPLYVLVYDMVNTGLADQATTYHALLNFIESKPAGTRFAIYVNSDGLHLIQGFTADKELLRAAITGRGPGPHIPNQFLLGANYGRGDGAAVTQIFKFLADYLQGVPGRKNLIWLSGGMPASLSPDPNQEGQVDTEGVKSALEAMMRSQIALYPVDVRGVILTEERAGAAPGGGGPAAASGTGISTTASDMLNSEALGNFTGGHSYQGDNDIKALLEEAVADGKSYYTLSYAPTNEKYDYSGRHIAVSLAKKGYHLAYRQLYYALPEDAEAPTQKTETPDARFKAAKESDSALTASVEHGAPMLHDLIFRTYLQADPPAMATPEQMATLSDEPAYFRTHKKNQNTKPAPPVKLQRYRIDYTVIDPQLKAFSAKTGRPAAIEFAAVAYDANGRMLNGIVNDALSQSPAQPGAKPDPKKDGLFHVEQELYVPAGAAWIRMAVRDLLTNRTGTLEIPLPLANEPKTTARAGQ